MSLLRRLQESLGEVAAIGRERVRIPPFTGYVDALRTPKFYSFAIPDPDAGAMDLAAALPALREAYTARGRTARTEHIVEVCPALEEVVLADGWKLSERMPVMVCTPARFVAPRAPDGLIAERLTAESPDELVLGFLDTQRTAFEDQTAIVEGEVGRFQERAADNFCVAGLLDGEVAGTALCSPIFGGVTEVGGVATLAEYRRRGIAASLTAAAVAAAFEAGAEIGWLTAAGDSAQGIYARAGFEVVGTLLAYDAA